MKKNVWLVVVYIGLCSGAVAESYVVTKEGKGFWTSSVRKDEKAIYYMDKTTGEEKTLSLSVVDGLVLSVQRSEQYKPEQIKSHLENIRALIAKHRSLTRDLNQLQQEWEALQKGDPGFAKQIDAIVEKFNASDKGIKAYKGAMMDLGMIKYKDVQGKHAERIERTVGKVKNEFLTAGFARLEGMASTNRISVNDYLEVKNLANALSDAGQKEKAAGLIENIRRLALSLNAQEALAGFASSKTVEAYLVSNDLLIRIKNEIATEGDPKKRIDVMLGGLIRDVGKAQPAFNFDLRGYPMTKNDNTVLSSLQRFSSIITFTASDLEEQCFVFPLQRPENIRMNQRFSVPLRLIFNRAQPKDRIFGIMVLIPGGHGTDSHTVALECLQIKNGHADATFTDEFDHAEKDFAPVPDSKGEYGAYLSLGYRTSAAGESAQWCPISRACRFPITDGRGSPNR